MKKTEGRHNEERHWRKRKNKINGKIKYNRLRKDSKKCRGRERLVSYEEMKEAKTRVW